MTNPHSPTLTKPAAPIAPADGNLTPTYPRWRFSVAPMLDWTDRHCRYFHRGFSKHMGLTTEMVTTGAILHGDLERLLGFHEAEHPVVLQLGGSDPRELAQSIALLEKRGYRYDEINLNCGCPSPRVQKGGFGASLMLDPDKTALAFRAMREATDTPLSVKHRIGVDGDAGVAFTMRFCEPLYEAGCRHFIVHTRAAWLEGLSPKENRSIPPLDRSVAFALKRAFPDAVVVANGGIADLETAQALLEAGLDGVMVGRAAYHDPGWMAGVDAALYSDASPGLTETEMVLRMHAYLHTLTDPLAIRAALRHLMGFWQGKPGARACRRALSDPRRIQAEGADLFLKTYETWKKGSAF